MLRFDDGPHIVTLGDLGSIGELIGAVAVLVTLGYLAHQIRQSSRATRAQIRQSLADSQIHYLNARATDPLLRSAAEKMYYGRSLDASEAYGLRVHLTAHLRLFENYHAQHAIGTMDPEDWRAMREIIKWQMRFPAYREAFSANPPAWNESFTADMAEILAELDASSA
jgi:hypothetical protein